MKRNQEKSCDTEHNRQCLQQRSHQISGRCFPIEWQSMNEAVSRKEIHKYLYLLFNQTHDVGKIKTNDSVDCFLMKYL